MAPTKDLSVETISQIIGLHKANHSVKEIVALIGVSRTSVKKYIRRFKNEGEQNTPVPKKRPGRPRKASKRVLTIIKRDLETNPFTTSRRIRESNPQVLGTLSTRTVRRRIKELEFSSHKPAKKPLLSKKQQKKRVDFGNKYLNWPEENWLDVLWLDEATFNITSNSMSRVYRKNGRDRLDPKYLQYTMKHPDSLMVWGCFSGRGLGDLIILPKNEKINQYNYFELLCDHLPSSFEKSQATIFQQDGAPAHTAKSVTKWLQDCEVKYINDWPGNSPDINPIENLWAIMKADLQDKDVSTLPKLEAALKESWMNISPETLQNLALSIPKRLLSIKKCNGRATEY